MENKEPNELLIRLNEEHCKRNALLGQQLREEQALTEALKMQIATMAGELEYLQGRLDKVDPHYHRPQPANLSGGTAMGHTCSSPLYFDKDEQLKDKLGVLQAQARDVEIQIEQRRSRRG